MEFAARVRNLTSSPTLAITAKAKQMKAGGIEVVSFGAGEPDFDTPQRIKDAAVQALQAGFTKYTPSAGIPALKKAISEKFLRDNRLRYEPRQIVVCNGAKHALYNVLQVLCGKKDEVLVPAPYWVSYPEMVKAAEGKCRIIPAKEKNFFKISPAQLEKAIRPRAKILILNSPANPTGCVYSKEELEAIAGIAVRRGLWVISDEIYEKLIYDNEAHVSIASLNGGIYARTVTVNGLSKAYSMTGWRVGYLAAPAEVAEKISCLQDHSTSNPNSIAQMAAVEALTMPEDSIDAMRREFVRRRDYMVERVNRIKNLHVVSPKGAFYLFVNIAKTKLGSMAFAGRLLDEARVAVVPGGAFGDDRFVRLSFAVGMEEITKGLDRIEKWMETAFRGSNQVHN